MKAGIKNNACIILSLSLRSSTPYVIIAHSLMTIPILNVFFIHSTHFAVHLSLPMANHTKPIIVKHPTKNPKINSIMLTPSQWPQ